MKKLSFFFLTAFVSVIVCSCNPPKPGGSDSTPATAVEPKQPTIQSADTVAEKAVEGKNLKDSVMTGKK